MRINPEIKDIPNRWYNLLPDLDFHVPEPINPSGYRITYNDMEPLSPPHIINQELERERREIAIPKELISLYSNFRPTPIYRAENLEKVLGTSARIYFKDEGSNSSGGHEMNTALPQAYYASLDKRARCLVTAAGNGEWGAALATACNFFGLKCQVFMVRSSYQKKSFGRDIMEILGAEVVSSPSTQTQHGRQELAENPNSLGSIGLALSEAFEVAADRDDTLFAWGTVMNHVILHQTIIGLEARGQLKKIGVTPDIIIGAVGGGSGFGGLAFPFYPERSKNTRFIAVQTASAPTLTRGRYTYDYSDAKGLAFMLKMYTLGHGFMPQGIRAGDMRYHGISPIISALYREKQIEAREYKQHEAFAAALTFARAEGMIPSPQSAYAIKAVMDEAALCKSKNDSKNILFALDANSNLNLDTFTDFVRGSLENLSDPNKEIEKSLSAVPEISGAKDS